MWEGLVGKDPPLERLQLKEPEAEEVWSPCSVLRRRLAFSKGGRKKPCSLQTRATACAEEWGKWGVVPDWKGDGSQAGETPQCHAEGLYVVFRAMGSDQMSLGPIRFPKGHCELEVLGAEELSEG